MCTRVEKRSHTPTTSAADSESERERGATRKLASFRARMLARQARKVQGSVFKYVSVQRTATSFPDWFLHGWCLDLEFTNDWKIFHPREQECVLIIFVFRSRGDDTLLIILYSSPVMKMLWELCEREEREKDSAAREREEICSSGEEATAGVMPKLDKAASLSGASGIGERTRDPSLFRPSESEVNLYQLHVEDLLSLNPNAEEDPTVTDLDNKLLLYGFFSPSSSVLASLLPLSDCFRDAFSAVFLLRVGYLCRLRMP